MTTYVQNVLIDQESAGFPRHLLFPEHYKKQEGITVIHITNISQDNTLHKGTLLGHSITLHELLVIDTDCPIVP